MRYFRGCFVCGPVRWFLKAGGTEPKISKADEMTIEQQERSAPSESVIGIERNRLTDILVGRALNQVTK